MTRVILSLIVLSSCLLALPATATAQMTPERFLGRFDANGDGKVSKEEFTGKRRPFDSIDTDGDGVATRDEIDAAFGDGGSAGRPVAASASGPMQQGQVPLTTIDPATRCGIGRSQRCDIQVAVSKGLFPTGLRPRFPDGVTCRGIDEAWAISYTNKRGREQYHGGIDMPAPFGTPMLAAADGTVVHKSNEPKSYRGMEVIIRHAPEDTGLPVWLYTQYAHFDAMPSVNIGDRVRMGQNLGPTGNSGFQRMDKPKSKTRRPAIHFAVWFSDKPGYAVDFNDIIPQDGRWMDPNAMYRLQPPFDSASLRDLADAEKDVAIPVMVEGGGTIPAKTRLIWPYSCWR